MSCKIALFAEKSIGLQTLKLIEQSDAELAAVVASREATGLTTVWGYASKQGYHVLPAQMVQTPALASELSALNVDLILNIYSLYLVHPAVLSVPTFGSYNLHPGPLPEMAGLNVPDWAIYHQHNSHAITIHRMQAEIDTGAIAFEERFRIPDNATGLQLSLECGRRGRQLIEQLLECVLTGKPIPQTSQDLTRRRYYSGAVPDNGSIDLQACASQIVARIRAGNYRPFQSAWGHPVVRYRNSDIGLVDATQIDESIQVGTIRSSTHADSVLIGCGTGSMEVHTVYANHSYCPAASVFKHGGVVLAANCSR